MNKMKLCVGSPGSPADTQKILDAAGKDISEIYVAVQLKEFGSGRDRIYDLSFPELEETVASAKSYGVEISIAFNALCFGGKQFEGAFLERFDDLLSQLSSAGIAKLIIADPFLIDYAVRRNSFHVSVSSISMVDSIEKARMYENMGARRIILPMDCARKLDFVRALRGRIECEIEIMANLGCLYNCPHHTFHSQYHSHASRGELSDTVGDGDPYKEFCTGFMRREPWRALNASFLRPEDLILFDEIGVDYVKLAGRELGIDWVVDVAKAYAARSYEGNVLDLLSTPYGIRSSLSMANKGISKAFVDTTMGCDKHCFDRCRKEGRNFCERSSSLIMRYQASAHEYG